MGADVRHGLAAAKGNVESFFAPQLVCFSFPRHYWLCSLYYSQVILWTEGRVVFTEISRSTASFTGTVGVAHGHWRQSRTRTRGRRFTTCEIVIIVLRVS